MDWKITTTTSLNDSQGEMLRVLCPSCQVETLHKVLVSALVESTADSGDDWMKAWENHQIIQCQGCHTASFRQVSTSTEDIGGKNYDTLIEYEQLYPSRAGTFREFVNVHMLSPDIRHIYRETHSALINKMSVLGGIGIRALIETVCKEREAKGANLKQRIEGLVEQGILARTGADFLHSLRLMGNAAAHEVKPHSTEELAAAMAVVEHLLQQVYILPELTSTLPKEEKRDE